MKEEGGKMKQSTELKRTQILQGFRSCSKEDFTLRSGGSHLHTILNQILTWADWHLHQWQPWLTLVRGRGRENAVLSSFFHDKATSRPITAAAAEASTERGCRGILILTTVSCSWPGTLLDSLVSQGTFVSFCLVLMNRHCTTYNELIQALYLFYSFFVP